MKQIHHPQPTRDSPSLSSPEPRPRRHAQTDFARALTFAPLAWLKLKFFCHAGDTEVGGFAISAAADPLYVTDFLTVRQRTTAVTVKFDDAAVADLFDAAVDRGLRPDRFARIWCHTHPGDSPEPSVTDEHTFARVFGGCDWSVMFILARTGDTYARLAFAAGPGGSVSLPVHVDWEAWPAVVLEQADELPSLMLAWAAEFDRNVHPVPFPRPFPGRSTFPRLADHDVWPELASLHALQFASEQDDEAVLRLAEAEGKVWP